jgi:FixJ family two-component response regulator
MHLSGHEVSTFSTGSAFLHAFLHGLEPDGVECVVCEAELPDISGLEVYAALTEKAEGIPFALLISHTDPATLAAANKAGIRHVFYKPLVHRRLAAFVAGR